MVKVMQKLAMPKLQLQKLADDLMLHELIGAKAFSEKGRYVGMGLLVLSVLLFFVVLLKSFFAWHSDFVISHQKPAVSRSLNADGDMQLIASIPSQHVFGQSAVEDADFLPVTSLQLHLTGIEKNTESNLSKVIISQAGQPGKVYTIGDEIADGIKINAINDDSIVLAHGGRFEKLPLARAPLLFEDKPKPLWQDVA